VGSLLEGIDTTSPADKAPRAKVKNAGAGSGKTVKLVVALGGLLVGGALIAWNTGLLTFGEPAPNSPQAASSSTVNAAKPQTNNAAANASASQQSDPGTAPALHSGPQTIKK
jgi:hypothetical protein